MVFCVSCGAIARGSARATVVSVGWPRLSRRGARLYTRRTMPSANSTSTARTALGAGLLALLLLGPGRTHAADDGDADARLQKLAVSLKEQNVADTRHAATAELGKAEALRDKARTLIGERRERETLGRTLDELEGTLSLVGAKIKHAEAKAKLDEAKQKRDALKAELAKVKADADALEKQQAELEKKLGGGK